MESGSVKDVTIRNNISSYYTNHKITKISFYVTVLLIMTHDIRSVPLILTYPKTGVLKISQQILGFQLIISTTDPLLLSLWAQLRNSDNPFSYRRHRTRTLIHPFSPLGPWVPSPKTLRLLPSLARSLVEPETSPGTETGLSVFSTYSRLISLLFLLKFLLDSNHVPLVTPSIVPAGPHNQVRTWTLTH